MRARISEIFSSIQGEGIYSGVRQIFVRFFGCSLKCSYCDTKPETYCEYSVDNLIRSLLTFGNHHHSISFTGGEPLKQVKFLEKLLPEIKKNEPKLYLETNGVDFEPLERVIDNIDI